jgi:hypothetical protein
MLSQDKVVNMKAGEGMKNILVFNNDTTHAARRICKFNIWLVEAMWQQLCIIVSCFLIPGVLIIQLPRCLCCTLRAAGCKHACTCPVQRHHTYERAGVCDVVCHMHACTRPVQRHRAIRLSQHAFVEMGGGEGYAAWDIQMRMCLWVGGIGDEPARATLSVVNIVCRCICKVHWRFDLALRCGCSRWQPVARWNLTATVYC